MRLICFQGFDVALRDRAPGRGMGLSVVAQAVARAAGAVDIGPARRAEPAVTLSAAPVGFRATAVCS